MAGAFTASSTAIGLSWDPLADRYVSALEWYSASYVDAPIAATPVAGGATCQPFLSVVTRVTIGEFRLEAAV